MNDTKRQPVRVLVWATWRHSCDGQLVGGVYRGQNLRKFEGEFAVGRKSIHFESSPQIEQFSFFVSGVCDDVNPFRLQIFHQGGGIGVA